MKSEQQKLVAAVTGANGLIGCCIVEMLVKKGWIVKALVRPDSALLQGSVSIVMGDINDKVALKDLVDGADAVFHCAAELHDESKMYEVNVRGVKTLLDVLVSSSVNYLCFISSAGVVGPTKEKLITEETACHPYKFYEKTKYMAEKVVLSSEFNGRVCILRPTNVVGYSKKGVLTLPLRDNWKDKLTCFFKGKEHAHIVHVKDVASASIFLYEKLIKTPEIFFVSYDEDLRNINSELYDLVRRNFKKYSGTHIPSLPIIVPYLVRSVFKGRSLHGSSRFSSQKIRRTGFCFRFDVGRIVSDVCYRGDRPS